MSICLCRSIKTTVNICRLFGLCPLSWKHVDGCCFFYRSSFWIIYMSLMLVAHIYYLSQNIVPRFEYTVDKTALLEYISNINHNIGNFFIATMILLNLIRAKKLAEVLNKCSELSKLDLLCQSSLTVLRVFHIGVFTLFITLYVIQYAAILMLNFLDDYDTNWTHKRFLQPMLHNTPLLYGIFVVTICVIYNTLLCCFEKVMMVNLKFVPVHPMPNFDETNENRQLFLIYKYQRCKGCHKDELPFVNQLDKVQQLKNLHEKIRACLSAMNTAFSPQLVAFLVLEILTLVVHWYLVILYLTLDKPNPEQATINFFNWLFVIVHTWCLFLFLKQADHMEGYNQGLLHVLFEYSTRINTPEEFQQMRFFIENIKNGKGLSASGVFNVNLRISGPIAANVLMYVLVAVQFRHPNVEA